MHGMTSTLVWLREHTLRLLTALAFALLCVAIAGAPGAAAQGPAPGANRAISAARERALTQYRTAHEQRVAARLDALLYPPIASTTHRGPGAQYRAAHERRVAARLAR